MTRPILIPLDGSELSEQILGPVEPLARRVKAPLVLVRVVERRGTSPEQEDELDKVEAELKALGEKLEQRDLEGSGRLEQGDPAERILGVIDDIKPQLVAMTTHGRTGMERLFRGSVAERVLRHCPVPLLLVNPHSVANQGEYFKRILVPLDGSGVADSILPLVEQMAWTYGSGVTLLRVEPFLYSALPSPVLQQDLWDENRTKESLEKQRQRLAEGGIQVEVKAAYGVEATEILAAADDADLVMMSTHGRSGVSRWWFGSVAESVIRHCACPLLVQRAQ